jgi:uncharacterized membrane protein
MTLGRVRPGCRNWGDGGVRLFKRASRFTGRESLGIWGIVKISHDKAAARACLCVALVLVGVLFLLVFRLPPRPVLDTGTRSSTVGPVTARTTYVQEITIQQAVRLSAVEVQLATWGRLTNTTHDEIRVFDGAGHLIKRAELPPGAVADNAYVHVEFPQALDVPDSGKLFVALSSADGTPSDSITAWTSPWSGHGRLYSLRSAELDQGSLVVNTLTAHQRPGSLCLRVLGLGRRALILETLVRILGLLAFAAVAAGVWWADCVKRGWVRVEAALDVKNWRKDASIAWFYLAFALIWGLALIVVTPPFQVADEPAHFFRAWSVANLEIVAQQGGKVALPENVATLPDRIGFKGSDWAANHYSAKRVAGMLWEGISQSEGAKVTTAAGYAPTGYLPQAIGIEIARVLGHSPLLGLYLARLLNLLATTFIVFLAIRTVPFGKPLLALVALLPMFVAEAASMSPDGLTLSGSLLFLALILRLITRETASARELIAASCVGVVLLNAKPGYAVLILLVFMVRPQQVRSVRRYLVWVGATIGAAFALGGAIQLAAPQMPPGYLASMGRAGVDAGGQMSFVLGHPFEFVVVLYSTFDQQALGLFQTAYGVLGWLSIGLPTIGMCAMALGAILLLARREQVPTAPWQRLVLVVTGVILAIGISAGMYTGWSAVAAPVVSGLQGRYFIPLVPLGLYAIYGLRPTRQRVTLGVLAVAVVVAAATTMVTLVRFYY